MLAYSKDDPYRKGCVVFVITLLGSNSTALQEATKPLMPTVQIFSSLSRDLTDIFKIMGQKGPNAGCRDKNWDTKKIQRNTMSRYTKHFDEEFSALQ